MPAPRSVEETLSWEAENRSRAAWATVGGGVLGLIGVILFIVVTSGGPSGDEQLVDVVDAIGAAVEGQRAGPGVTVQQVEFLGERAPALIAATIAISLGILLALSGLVFLWQATRNRAPDFGRLSLVAVVAGGVAYAVGQGVRFVALLLGAADFEDGPGRTAEAARDVFTDPTVNAGTILETLGTFGLAVGILLLALNAMRVGLLTRFMGILGILVGVLFVFPIDRPGIVRWFWLISLGVLLTGRWPNGLPPAWQTGRAEPWPSQQELAERRRALKEGRDPEPPAADRDAEDSPAPGAAAGPKRKRKRRR